MCTRGVWGWDGLLTLGSYCTRNRENGPPPPPKKKKKKKKNVMDDIGTLKLHKTHRVKWKFRLAGSTFGYLEAK